MKYFLFIAVLVLTGCSPQLRHSFKKVSKSEKVWAIFHPLKAKKAFFISKEAEKTKDSIANYGSIGKDNNGGHLDAFKHSFWMASLTQKIGKNAAIKLGKAHEKGNYKTYKNNKLEDGYVPDKISSAMDLHNNKIGVKVGLSNLESSKNKTTNIIISAIKKGEMKIIKKDAVGNFLTCKGIIISKKTLKGKWENNKCLISSDGNN
ncbi:MAG: hypothetical protein L3J08_08925 [Flavobacteriaceae bacterium]|nr:hypothetical protein [Flavobacteriaceae bacterium]